MTSSSRTLVAGPAIVLPGDDIDTDRIMPARFLRAITFDGIEAHLFEDDRRSLASQGATHPFDDVARRSRAHPHRRREFRLRLVARARAAGDSAVGDSARSSASRSRRSSSATRSMIGLPCVTVAAHDAQTLTRAVQRDAGAVVTVDLQTRTVSAPGVSVAAAMPDSARDALISGQWDATGLLLEHYEDVEGSRQRLPYIQGF